MRNMRMSDAGLDATAAEESFVGHPYKDFAGVWTKGYGHAIKAGESTADVTDAEAKELLRLDVRTAEDAVNRLVTVDLDQGQFDALVDFAFNAGGHALATSTLLKKLNGGDYAGAADEFLRWVKYNDGGVMRDSPTLVARRKRERAMFLSSMSTQPARAYSPNIQPGSLLTKNRPANDSGNDPEAA